MKMKLTRNQLITINALLCAIVLLFVFVPITIGTVQLAFIPLVAIIVSAEFIGWKNGMFTGLFFGLVSLISAIVRPSPLSFAFYNPMVSIVPRVLIGLSAYFAAAGVKKISSKIPDYVSYSVGAIAGVVTNTVGVLGMIAAFYFGTTLEGTATAITWPFIAGIIVSNSLLEIAICAVIVPPIVMALKTAFKNKYN